MREDWEADRVRHADEVRSLRHALTKAREEKEAATGRLVKELAELQIRHSASTAQSRAQLTILEPELYLAERAHTEHADALSAALAEQVCAARVGWRKARRASWRRWRWRWL